MFAHAAALFHVFEFRDFFAVRESSRIANVLGRLWRCCECESRHA
jgi:hypothetical protein